MSAKPVPKPESKAKEADKETALGEFVDIGQKTFKGKDDAVFDVIETMVRCRPAGALMFACEQAPASDVRVEALEQINSKWMPICLGDAWATFTGPVWFYPCKPGQVVIDCRMEGARMQPAAELGAPSVKVKSTEPKLTVLKIAQPEISNAVALPKGDALVIRGVHGKPVLEYCGDNGKAVGILFDCVTALPPKGCRYSLLQTCTGYRRYTRLNDKVLTFDTGGKAFLDTEVPYRACIVEEHDDNEDQLQISGTDSPNTPLYPSCKKIEVCETFHTYLACKPTFGPWTTFARVTWSWEACACPDASAPLGWAVTSKKMLSQDPIQFVPTTEQPQWHDNVTSLGEAISKEFAKDFDEGKKDTT